MTYLNAKKYILSCPDNISCDKERFNSLLQELGSPQKNIKYLRLAGSNGKTVMAEMLMSVMKKAGYTAGCLYMPTRQEPRNNICIGSATLSMDTFAEYTKKIRDCSRALGVTPSRAEILLLIALMSFKNAHCNICIIESDHFGTDPSKMLPPPFAAVICGAIPNGDRGEIAKIRSYIYRGISELVSVPQNSEAHKIITDTCYSINCRPNIPAQTEISVGRLSFGKTEFSYRGRQYTLGLCGRFQISNAMLLLKTVEMLGRFGYKISYEQVNDALSSLKIPAKFEVLSISPLMIADTTHTPVAIEAVCDSLADFKDITPKSVRLCLPNGEIIEHYIRALTKRGYSIEKIITDGTQDLDGYTCFCASTPKHIARACLDGLDKGTLLLMSGTPSFVLPIRYELLGIMGF